MLTLSIGIMAYNEEANIGRLLSSLLGQSLAHAKLTEIFVVASGCTDRTEEIVNFYVQKDDRIKLVTQPRREGKASAINLFLSRASGDICDAPYGFQELRTCSWMDYSGLVP